MKNGKMIQKTKQLPTGWKEKKICEFTEVITGGTPSTIKKEYWENGNISWLPSGDLKDKPIKSAHIFITNEGLKNSSAQIMPKKSVLIALTGATTGQTAILEIEASANQSVTGILPSKEHIPKFLFYYLRTIRNKILNQTYGGAQPHISQGFVKNVKIPLPPLPIQKQIVAILEKAEALKQRREKADKLTKEYLKSVFAEMFLKKGFEEKELEKVADIIMGQSPPGNSYNEKGEGTPFFQGKAEFTEKYPLIKKWTTKPSKLAEPNSILISVRAPVGDVNLCNVKCCIGRGLASIKPIKKLANLYYIYFLLQSIKDKIEYLGSGSTFKAINSRQLRNLKIPLPPLPLQQKFANIVEKVEKLKEKQKQSKEEINIMFDALMQKAFKGELVKDGKK